MRAHQTFLEPWSSKGSIGSRARDVCLRGAQMTGGQNLKKASYPHVWQTDS